MALCLDLTLRGAGAAPRWTRDARPVGALRRRAHDRRRFAAVLASLGGRSFKRELGQWVHGTREMPCASWLHHHGVAVTTNRPSWRNAWDCGSPSNGAIQVKTVLRGGRRRRRA